MDLLAEGQIFIGKAVGKRIVRVHLPMYSQYLGLVFEDGSYAIVIAYQAGYDETAHITNVEGKDIPPTLLLSMGIIDEAESERRYAKLEEDRKLKQEQHERATYEKLKAKFAG